ncbi:MAG TPA: putative metal-binding motif-containing protein, partial [Myxococcota bacterium]|nr:putative metal-binding motif-containing protein [Myxococcota bacterium]
MHRLAWVLVSLGWCTAAHAQVLVNGDFESGPLTTGWSTTGVNGGVVTVVNQGTQFSALGTPTAGIPFPSPTHAASLRSAGSAPVSSTAILTSGAFLVTNEQIGWSLRSESSQVAVEARVLFENSTPIDITAVGASSGTFARQTLDLAGHCGQTRRLQLRQHTTQAGSGWFTLIDDVALTGPPCPDFRDDDHDGYCPGGRDFNGDGDCADPAEPVGAADCDDDDPTISPAAFDVPGNGIDEDCSGDFLCYEDADGDGRGNSGGFVIPSIDPSCDQPGEALTTDDCDDRDAAVYPGAPDVPADAVDQDCDGDWACWADLDLDGFGTSAATVDSPDATCVAPGESATTTDCDDTRPLVHPGGLDLPADGLDQDCDGDWACYADGDRDGYGSTSQLDADAACANPGASSNAQDCDDRDDRVHPGAYDLPANRVDEDCDGDWACWLDGDADGHGTSAATLDGADDRCLGPNQSTSIDDCDDADPTIHPGGADLPADGVDQDCDGDYACYVDRDLDHYGASQTVDADAGCAAPGSADNDRDCDDHDAEVNPDAYDVPADTGDQDCDGS